MTHEPKKSDLAKVAMKPTKKNPDCRRGRSQWSEGRGPRGAWTSKASTGRRFGIVRTGIACHRRWDAYVKQQRREGGNGAARCSTMLTLICFGCRFTRSSVRRLREWMG